MSFVTYETPAQLMRDLAQCVARDLRGALDEASRASLVVPGGTTPGPMFDVLSGLELPWERVNVLLSDERWVPVDDARSNTGLIKRRLLQGPASAARYVPLYAPYEHPEDGVAALQEGLEACLPLAVVVLGMGADMHTASLFPQGDALAQALAPDAPVLVPMRQEGLPEPRITLSARILAAAPSKHILITGDEKRAAYECALTLTELEAPVRAVLPGAQVHWAPVAEK